MRHEYSLDSLNFFLADLRQGLGPYLAIYLLTGSAAFLVLAGIAASGFLLYFFAMPETRDLDAGAPSAIAKRALSR
jgi:hypothetical protein